MVRTSNSTSNCNSARFQASGARSDARFQVSLRPSCPGPHTIDCLAEAPPILQRIDAVRRQLPAARRGNPWRRAFLWRLLRQLKRRAR